MEIWAQPFTAFGDGVDSDMHDSKSPSEMNLTELQTVCEALREKSAELCRRSEELNAEINRLAVKAQQTARKADAVIRRRAR